ncbi:unnamed protein product [Rotaria sordida]|uniref:Uncharacterized protein n=1 Tax=Rotaria sordida TaxID=392033 RepID=A0A815CVU3_9BILA|nr:unnamed protein product [Rotaria sordida]
MDVVVVVQWLVMDHDDCRFYYISTDGQRLKSDKYDQHQRLEDIRPWNDNDMVVLTKERVKWNFSTAVVETIPNQLPPVYAKDCLIVYGLLDDKSISFDHNSSVELEVDQQQLSVARISRIPSISENGMITRLAAKALILELQHAKLPAKRTTVGSRQYRN